LVILFKKPKRKIPRLTPTRPRRHDPAARLIMLSLLPRFAFGNSAALLLRLLSWCQACEKKCLAHPMSFQSIGRAGGVEHEVNDAIILLFQSLNYGPQALIRIRRIEV
jgi:hypothetical protein